jgi:hypothetical protein
MQASSIFLAVRMRARRLQGQAGIVDIPRAAETREERMFFFEKKNQKTSLPLISAWATAGANG